MQAVFTHQMRTDPGQVAFVAAGKTVEQQFRHRQTQHRVAQKLKPLVVVGAKAAVGECALQQQGTGELVPQAALQ